MENTEDESKDKINKNYSYHSVVRSKSKDVEQLKTKVGDLYWFSLESCFKGDNQDALGIYQIGEKTLIFLVSDGMGGHPMGDVASEKIVQQFCLEIERKLQNVDKINSIEELRALCLSSLELADREIKNLKVGAGATVCLFALYEQMCFFINAGDSKGALLGQKGKEKYETIEHSSVGHAHESGLVKKDHFPHDGVLCNGLGFENMYFELGQCIELNTFDIVCVYSDGITKIISHVDVKSWATNDKFEDRMNHLAQKFLAHPQENLVDDTTMILFRFQVP